MQNHPFRLTDAEEAEIANNGAEIAASAPDDISPVEVLTAIAAASMVGARLGIPVEKLRAVVLNAYPAQPEAA